MTMYYIYTNKYNDLFIDIENDHTNERLHQLLDCYKKNVIIVRSCLPINNDNLYLICDKSKKITDQSKGFCKMKFLTGECESVYVYINYLGIKNMPIIIDDYIECSIVTIFINNKYFLYVKDKLKQKYTNPGGKKNSIKESFEECATREIYEETSIKLDKNKLIELGSYQTDYEYYAIIYRSKVKIYGISIEIGDKEIERIKNHKNREIENIGLYDINNSNDINKISYQHLYFSWIYYSKIKNISNNLKKPVYLENFEIK